VRIATVTGFDLAKSLFRWYKYYIWSLKWHHKNKSSSVPKKI
jgi:hypothetical protein